MVGVEGKSAGLCKGGSEQSCPGRLFKTQTCSRPEGKFFIALAPAVQADLRLKWLQQQLLQTQCSILLDRKCDQCQQIGLLVNRRFYFPKRNSVIHKCIYGLFALLLLCARARARVCVCVLLLLFVVCVCVCVSVCVCVCVCVLDRKRSRLFACRAQIGVHIAVYLTSCIIDCLTRFLEQLLPCYKLWHIGLKYV